jgi:hypothetical protein
MRTEEFAFLANALVAGCSIQARPFTEREAADAVLAICNLGLENWPHAPAARTGTPLPEDLLVRHDLVGVFEIGWSVLHQDVCMHAAECLIDVLADVRCDDRDIQSSLDALRRDMTKHWRAGTPWRAREAMDVIAILDMPAWAALLGLIDECPVLHEAITAAGSPGTHAVGAAAFDFIAENTQIAAARAFLQALPGAFAQP